MVRAPSVHIELKRIALGLYQKELSSDSTISVDCVSRLRDAPGRLTSAGFWGCRHAQLGEGIPRRHDHPCDRRHEVGHRPDDAPRRRRARLGVHRGQWLLRRVRGIHAAARATYSEALELIR